MGNPNCCSGSSDTSGCSRRTRFDPGRCGRRRCLLSLVSSSSSSSAAASSEAEGQTSAPCVCYVVCVDVGGVDEASQASSPQMCVAEMTRTW